MRTLCALAFAVPGASAAACAISGAWYSASTGGAIAVASPANAAFTASAAGAWQDVPGTFFAANGSAVFSCCGGITGAMAPDCASLAWADAHQDVWVRAAPPSGQSGVLSSPLLTVGLSALPSGAVSLSAFSFFGAGANTTNLALQGTPPGTLGSSLVLPAAAAGSGAGALVPRCQAAGCALASSPTTLALTGLLLPMPGGGGGGSLAAENWTLTLLNASAFSWRVDRRYLQAPPGPLGVDRLALSLQTTGGQPIHAQQIPGYVALDMFLNATSTGGFDLGNGAFQYLTPSQRQHVRFTPTGALFIAEGAAVRAGAPWPLLFSFAKPFADGTAWCSVGFEAVDPRAGAPAPPPPAPGDVHSTTLTLHLVETDIPTAGAGQGPFPVLDLALRNASLQAQVAQLLGAQYQLNGWIFGNNPASVPCLHEMAWWPLIASVYPGASSVVLHAMQQELSFFAGCGWSPVDQPGGEYQFVHSCSLRDGAAHGFTHRYASSGFYNCPWGPLADEDVMFPIAVYYAAVSSGDLAWLASLAPALQAVEAFLASRGLGLNATPVVFTSTASGLADGGRHASNWYDVINFGHLDAYLAVHGVWAVQCLVELYAALGDGAGAARAAALHAAAVRDFNAVFWNASFAGYTDWIDVAGRKRHYFYVDIAFVAILTGTASQAQAAALLDHYDARLAEIYSTYNVTPGSIWSAPCSLYPITDSLEYANMGPGKHVPFPGYENGGAFFHSPGLQFAALAAAGRADAAYDGFVALVNSGFGEVRGWAQQLYWGVNHAPNALVGGDPLNTAALSVWGFLRAGFGVVPTLTRGLSLAGKPAAGMEGARWTFSHLGQDVCVAVQGGVTAHCNGTALPAAAAAPAGR